MIAAAGSDALLWLPASAAPGADGAVVGLELDGRRIALARVDGELFAVSDICPHQSALLSGGAVVGHLIECPAHYALFDLRDGKPTGGLACRDLRTYPVRVEGELILIGLPRAASG